MVAGVASGSLASGFVFVVLAYIAGQTGSETIEGLALTLAVLVGMAVGGAVAGRLARVNGRFHGSVTGLALAGITVVVARLGGSPTPVAAVLLLAAAAIVIGGFAGAWGFARRPPSQID
jgi:putative membrane protein (TIGR04086 family)